MKLFEIFSEDNVTFVDHETFYFEVRNTFLKVRAISFLASNSSVYISCVGFHAYMLVIRVKLLVCQGHLRLDYVRTKSLSEVVVEHGRA